MNHDDKTLDKTTKQNDRPAQRVGNVSARWYLPVVFPAQNLDQSMPAPGELNCDLAKKPPYELMAIFENGGDVRSRTGVHNRFLTALRSV